MVIFRSLIWTKSKHVRDHVKKENLGSICVFHFKQLESNIPSWERHSKGTNETDGWGYGGHLPPCMEAATRSGRLVKPWAVEQMSASYTCGCCFFTQMVERRNRGFCLSKMIVFVMRTMDRLVCSVWLGPASRDIAISVHGVKGKSEANYIEEVCPAWFSLHVVFNTHGCDFAMLHLCAGDHFKVTILTITAVSVCVCCLVETTWLSYSKCGVTMVASEMQPRHLRGSIVNISSKKKTASFLCQLGYFVLISVLWHMDTLSHIHCVNIQVNDVLVLKSEYKV